MVPLQRIHKLSWTLALALPLALALSMWLLMQPLPAHTTTLT